MELILASQSPRRRELLESVGLSFRVEAADIDESVKLGEQPDLYVQRLARAKAAVVAERNLNRHFVLGADTTVSIHGQIFGKPETTDEAADMLSRLSGGDHYVTTGYSIAIPGGRIIDGVTRTTVSMRDLSTDEIAWYVATGEPFDKAGGYAIQGRAAHFITKIEGSYTNVVGLPLAEVVLLLRAFGFPVAVLARTP
jgi:septum formation protein